MAKTKNEEYIVEQYVRYFGETPTDAEIAKYAKFGKAKLILNEIRIDAGLKNANMSKDEQIHDLFNNLFGRDALDSELTKYKVKYLDKGKALPINSIIKAAKKGSSDKAVWDTKKAVAFFIAEKGSTTNIDLDKITKDTYKKIFDGKKLTITTVAQLKAKIDAMPDNVAGETFNLTAGSDVKTGTEKGDVFNSYDFVSQFTGTVISTLNNFDTLDGKDGNDTLNIITEKEIGDTGNALVGSPVLNLTSIETVNVTSSNNVELDGTEWNGTTALNVIKAIDVELTAAATTDVNVSGTTGTVDVDGGKNVTVTDAKAAVVLDNAKGNVTVTDATQTAAITINDGANVTVTATSAVSNSTITIGGTNGGNTGNATGDVVVTSNLNGADAATLTGAAINVIGGKTVNVTVNATSAETKDDNNVSTTTQGAINVTADNTTTSVTVKQTASVTGSDAVTAVAGVNEVSTIKFVTLANNGAVTIDGLTFTNTSGVALSAADVAAAFANLTAGEIQGCSTKGTYSGAWGGNWTSSAVATDTVTFTAVAQSTTSDISTGASIGGATLAVVTAGKTAVTADAGKGTIATGVVTILDNATASITTVSVDGYKDSLKIGVNGTSTAASLNALTDLTLANGDIGADIDVATTATSLNLTLNNITSVAGNNEAEINLDHDGNTTAAGSKTIKTLNITTAGKDSDVEITAAAVETLTVSGTNALDLTASTLTALKTVTVSGTAGLTIAASGANVTSVTTTATTGAVTATIDAENATYTGGAGVDNVTLSNNDIDKAISLGAGDDKLTLATSTALADITVTVDGGAGDADTLVMDAVDAQDASASNAFDLKVINFERLSLLQVAVDNATATVSDVVTVDLSKLTYDYVITAGTATGGDDTAQDQLLLQNMANNGTVVLTSNGLVTVEVKDAINVANTADELNVIAEVAGDVNAGTLTAAGVETIKLTVTDTTPVNTTTGAAAINKSTLDLNATSAKTVTITGNADLDLDMTGNTKATLIDATNMTGDLKVTSYNTTSAVTIKGGAGDDTLTAADANFVTTLIGNAGDDRLVDAGGFAVLTGGEGNDTFVISNPATTSLFDFTTITDASSGDRIEFAEFAVGATVAFKATAVTLVNPNGATLQDYANKAISTTDTRDISWFTFGGDSYLVVNQSNNALSFNNSIDTIVKLTGVTDLNASFNDSATTAAFIEIC